MREDCLPPPLIFYIKDNIMSMRSFVGAKAFTENKSIMKYGIFIIIHNFVIG